MTTNHVYLQVLIQFQQWRTDSEDVPMPDPRAITDALDWAIRELAARKPSALEGNPEHRSTPC